MKKLFFVIPLIVVLAFFGCTKDSNPSNPGGGGPAAPTNVSIQAITGGLGIDVIWTAVAGVDSYEVDLPGSNNAIVIDTTSGTKTYSHNSPTEMGTYRVRAFDNNTAGSWSTSYSTSPVQGSGTIYEWDASGHSCYYWISTGEGFTISRLDASATTYCDIYAYDNTSSDLWIFCSQEPPFSGLKSTAIYYDASSVSPYAHTTPWFDKVTVFSSYVNNGYIWIELENGHYVRLRITSITSTSISFSYNFQTVQAFRYVD